MDDPLAWEIAPLRPPRAPRVWAVRLGAALVSGFRAGFLPAVMVIVVYYLANSDADMPWLKIASMLAVYAPGVSITLALVVELAVMLTDRIANRWRWLGWLANPVTAGGIAGGICGIVPGAIGVVGFGSYRGPFVGTWLIACSAMSGALLVAVPAARRARTARRGRHDAGDSRAIVRATVIATLILVGVASIIAPLLVNGAFVRVAGTLDLNGALVGAVVGAIGGVVLGLYIGLVIALARPARSVRTLEREQRDRSLVVDEEAGADPREVRLEQIEVEPRRANVAR